MSDKVKFEFYCSECKKYFDIKLNINLNGNYRIHCPMCNHIHYREITDGQITDTRFDKKDGSILIEDIKPMKSSCRDFKIELPDETDKPEEHGFLREKWLSLRR